MSDYYVENGQTLDSINLMFGSMYVNSGGRTRGINLSYSSIQAISGGIASGTTISSGSVQNIYDNGSAIYTMIYASGCQNVYDYSTATSTTVSLGGLQTVYQNGQALKTIISSGGSQAVYGGAAKDTNIDDGAIQIIYDGSVADVTKISGTQYVSDGGKATSTTILDEGHQIIVDGGIAIETNIYSGGSQIISKGGTATHTTISGGGTIIARGNVSDGVVHERGRIHIYEYATTSNITYNNGAEQYIHSNVITNNDNLVGWSQIIYAGGSAVDTTVTSQGLQEISGYAKNTTVELGGEMQVHGGGAAFSPTVKQGGLATVFGDISAATVQNGGVLKLNHGALATDVKVETGGIENVSAGATDINAVIAGSMNVAGSASSVTILEGGTVTLTGSLDKATVTNGGTLILDNAENVTGLKLDSGAVLSINRNTDMQLLKLDTRGASLTITGSQNKLNSVKINERSLITYDITSVKANTTSYMVDFDSKNTLKTGSFHINMKKNQSLGVYGLSTNIVQVINTKYVINLAGQRQGIVRLNGLGLIKNNYIYTIQNISSKISLTVAKAGKLIKGSTKNDKLTATTNCDIFYGGKGNDTITGKNGQDIAVYDKVAWGKDIISKTSGSMTILFNGIQAKQIVTKKKGNNLIIAKRNDVKQTITVKNYSNTTHNIVYGTNCTAFNSWLKATSPSAKQITAARNELMKKAGLASA